MAQRDLTVHLIGDSRSLERAFTRSSKSAKGFEHDIGRASRGALSAAVSFRGLGRALAFGSVQFLGGAGIVFAFKQIIAESSRVQEEIEKTGVVFAGNSREVQAWSKTLAQSFGVSEAAALEAAGRFGNMLRPLGFAAPAAAQMSERLVELAADMASFNNTKPDVVFEALSSGIAGQVRPLRQYGVFLSQARIQTEAYQDGIARTGAKLTQAQKVQAAYNIILKDTRNAQGDVARNTESLSVAQSKLTAGVEDLEARLGTALLPSLTSYVNKAAEWLNQTKNQERVQRDFSGVVKDVSGVLKDVAATVRGVDKVTGGFKNTLELLLALKLASFATNAAAGIGLIGTTSQTAAERVALLRGSLTKLGAIGAVTVVVEVVIHRKQVDDFIEKIRRKEVELQQNFPGAHAVAKAESEVANAPGIKQGLGLLGIKNVTPESLLQPLTKLKDGLDRVSSAADAMGDKVALAGAKAAHGLALAAQAAVQSAEVTKRALNITAAQRNTFFDNAIARILSRGGLGSIQEQIGALQRANALIETRLKATKDVTRKLHLEDELLQNTAQIKSLNAQQATDALQKRQDAVSEVIARLQLGVTKAQATATFTDDIAALKALQAGIKAEIREFGLTADLQGQLFDAQQQIVQARKDQAAKRLSDLTARQFKQLGLTATGDEITPGVANLKKRLQQISASVAGTTLDTPKLEAQLARFRKVLSEGLVPKDVRAKIRDMLDGIREELGKGTQNLTKFRHVSTTALLAGLGLSPDVARQLQLRLSQVGPNGSFPGARSAAFAAAGARNDINLTTTVVLDRNVVGRSVTKVQQKDAKRSTGSRRGTYAGRH